MILTNNFYNKKIKLILFDFDGVLVNSEPFYFNTWKKLLANYNINFSSLDLVSKNNIQFLSQFGFNESEIESLKKQKYLLENEFFNTAKLDYELFELIKFLSTSYKLSIVSNNSKTNISNYLSNNLCVSYFETIISNEDKISPKPSPEGYLKALNFFEFNKENALIVEDSQIGIEAAENAQIDFVQFDYSDIQSSINIIKNKLKNQIFTN